MGIKRFANLSPKRYERLPKRIEQLSKSTYLAIQRTLENVWFGVSDPLRVAIDDVSHLLDDDYISEDSIKEHLSVFINLLVRRILWNDLPESVSNLLQISFDNQEAICKGLVEEYPQELQALRREIDRQDRIISPLRDEVRQKDRIITNYRERKKQHDKNIEAYLEKIRQLNDTEIKLQSDLALLSEQECLILAMYSDRIKQQLNETAGGEA